MAKRNPLLDLIQKSQLRKKSPARVKQLLSNPLPKNAAGFGKCWIGDTLYYTDGTNETLIPKTALDSMKQKRGREPL